MTNPVLNPTFLVPQSSVPTLPNLGLSDEEAGLATWLSMRLFDQRQVLMLHGLYYDGMQAIQDLGISIPPELKGLRAVIGWPQIGVDSLDERLRVEGFRFASATDVDTELATIWDENELDVESSLGFLDSMIYGRSYWTVGVGDNDGDVPLITVESPLDMTAMWNPRMREVSSALQVYLDVDFTSDTYGQEVAALYLPDRTIWMARPNAGAWEIVDRNQHNLGYCPVVRMSNRQRTSKREGQSEITPAWMNTTDRACRTMLAAEVGREFFAAPQRYILGASEGAFQDAEGNAVSAWKTYIGRILALEADEDGNVPTVGQFTPGDPTAYTRLLDTDAKTFAGLAGLPPHYTGVVSDANPTSADAIRSSEARLNRRAERKQGAFGSALKRVMRLALQIQSGGALADSDMERLEVDWMDPATPTPAATSDAIFKQVSMGAIPATSDVTLKRLGYSAVERLRLAADRTEDAGASILAELATSLQAKEARADVTVARDINPAAVKATAPSPQVSGDSAGNSRNGG